MKFAFEDTPLNFLKEQGWFPERRIDIRPMLKAYDQQGFYYNAQLMEFLSLFGEMTLRLPSGHKLYIAGPDSPTSFSGRTAQLIWHRHGIFLTPISYQTDYFSAGHLYGSDGKVYMYVNFTGTIDTYTNSLEEFIADWPQETRRNDFWADPDDCYGEDLLAPQFRVGDFWEDLNCRYTQSLVQVRPPVPPPPAEPVPPTTLTFSESLDLHLHKDHWFPGRQVNTHWVASYCEEFNLFCPEKVLDFLRAFYHLQLHRSADASELSWCIEPDVPLHTEEDRTWLYLLYAHLKKPLTAVGFSSDQAPDPPVKYNLFMDAEGRFYRYDHSQRAFYTYGKDTRQFLETVYGVADHNRKLIGLRTLHKKLGLERREDFELLQQAYVEAVRAAHSNTTE